MRHRVFTYITRADQLLILKYVDGRYLQPQIPGGTVKAGELPAQAALREAQEETGLSELQLVKCLGSFERDLTDIGRDEKIVADCVAVRCRHFLTLKVLDWQAPYNA